MSKSKKELHEQVEQQRISLKKLIDKHTRNAGKVQNLETRLPKQGKESKLK